MSMKVPGIWMILVLLVCGVDADATEAAMVSEGDTIEIQFGGGTYQPGDTICLDMIVRGFTNVNSMQFTINWDPSVISFVDVRDVNPGNQVYNLFPSSYAPFNADRGHIRFVWFDDNVDGESAPDGFRMARLCFKVVGQPGDKTELAISDFPLAREAEDPNENPFCIPVLTNPICVGFPTTLFAKATACSTTGSDGDLTIKAWGSDAPFSVDIPGLGVAGDMIDTAGGCLVYRNLSPGNFTITVRDAMGNDTMINISVLDRPRLTIDTADLRFPTCFNDANGRIQIDVVGGLPFGQAPRDYYFTTWTPISASGETILRRIPGDIYTVIAEDSLGCRDTAVFDLNSNILSVDTNLIQLASCEGRDDGSLEVIPSGGTPFPGGNYDFFWSINPAGHDGRARTSTNDQLSGSGFVIVEDANGCRDTVFFEIPARDTLSVEITVDSVLCHGDSSGRVRIVATTSGMLATPYFYQITDDFGGPVVGGGVLDNVYNHDSIWAGRFILNLRDGMFCTLTDTFNVEEPDPLQVIIVDVDTSSGCGSDAAAYLEVNGFEGAGGPFTFQWDHNNATTARIDSLQPGMYTVTVFDKNMCEATRSFTVTGNNGPMITGFESQPVGCPGDTSGSAIVLFTPGDTSIASILWSNGEMGDTISNISQGTYRVTVTDENGCEAIDSVVIEPPMDGLMITSFIIDTPSCNGLFDGFIQINVGGGIGPYTFQWSNNERDSILTRVGAGQYIVAIRDQSNCPPVLDTFDIPEPPAIDISLLELDQVSCNDDTTCDGRAIATASGGPDPSRGYVFNWANGDIGFGAPDTIFNLCKGPQQLIVSNVDCADTFDLTVEAPPALGIDFPASDVIRPSCSGDMDGSITVVPIGGTGVKMVTWDRNNFMGNTLNNLTSGTYAFWMTDGNGCRYRDSIEVRDPDPLVASVVAGATSDITCPGGDDGRITILWNGGNAGPARFDWSPNVTSDSIAIELAEGDYTIVITDSKGCTDTVSETVMSPPPISADFPTNDSVPCFGEQSAVTVLNAIGGNGPGFTFSINNGTRRNLGEEVNLFAGTYQITVFDSRGCQIDTNVTISQPADFMVDLGPSPLELELGDSATICYATNLFGRAIDSIVWVGQGTPEDSTLRCYIIKPTENSIYSITLTDEFGCTATDDLEVIVKNEGRVFIPNAFLPEGNVNTVLTVYTGKSVREVNSMEIYNRWGELVYRGQNLQTGEGWNGRWDNSGEFLINDVYVYVVQVTYKDGSTETRRGDVTLIR